ncbi:MAG: glycoside hydrolase domain-containing protein [Planctomycetaceae bacterium]
MPRTTLHGLLFTLVSTTLLAVSPAAAEERWTDSFYQFRLPLETDSEKPGWQLLPLDEARITAAINKISPFRFDPHYFAYNGLRIVEVDDDGRVVDGDVEAGFTLVPVGPNLAANVLGGTSEKKTISVTANQLHLMTCTSSKGGKSPALAYEPIFPPGSRLRRANFRISFLPPWLPQSRRTHDVLFVPDRPQMELLLGGRFIGVIHDIAVRAAHVRLMANVKTPGRHRWMIYYQPMGSHHLQVPRLRRDRLPETTATMQSLGDAREYIGGTQYRVAEGETVRAWFAETTVKTMRQRPVPAAIHRGIRVTAAANESQSFQLVLRPRKSVTLQSATLGPLANGNTTLSTRTATVRLVEYVPIKTGSYITPARVSGDIGDPLLPLDRPVRLDPIQGNRSLWITLHVPPGTAAGTYSGTLRLALDEEILDVPVALEVFGFELPEFASFGSDMGGQYIVKRLNHLKQNPRRVIDYHRISGKQQILDLTRRYYDQMAAEKFYPKSVALLTEIGMNWTPPPQGFNVDRPGNFIRLKDWDFTRFNAELDHFINKGKVNSLCLLHTNPTACNHFNHLPGKPLAAPAFSSPHTSMGWQTWREMTIVAYDRAKTEKNTVEITRRQFDNVVMQFFRRTATELDKHGWLDRVHILIDETENPRRLAHFLKLLKSDPLTARIRTVACLQGLGLVIRNSPGNEGLTEFPFPKLIDTYCPEIDENYDRWMPYFFDDYQIPRDRRKLWCYIVSSSRIAIDTPGINNRILAMDVFRRGGSGVLMWESFGWDHTYGNSTNPWQDPYTRHANGSLSFFYPPRRDGLPKDADPTITPSLRLSTFRESVDDFEYARILEDLLAEARQRKVEATQAERILKDIHRFFPSNTHWSQNAAWFLELRERMAREIVALKARLAG